MAQPFSPVRLTELTLSWPESHAVVNVRVGRSGPGVGQS